MGDEKKIVLKKFLNEKLSVREEIDLLERLGNFSELDFERLLKSDFYSSMENELESKRKDLTGVLHKVHHQIHINKSEKQNRKLRKLVSWTTKVAAILFLPLLIYSSIYWYQNKLGEAQSSLIEIVAPQGSRVQFELPDGTIGTLNSQSKIQYASVFKDNRRVKVEGEAYFDVAHDKENPFRIMANENIVEVVGTKFSLTADKAQKFTELVLEEGKVKFNPPGQKESIDLLPGDRIVSTNGEIETTKVDAWKYTAWKDGKLVFRNESMEELANRIARWYNVDVEIKGGNLADYTFRGVFEDDSLEEVLSLLQMTSPINFEIEGRKEFPDGSFSKKKVILSKK